MTRCAVTPYEGEKDYLFISYSHKDAERINPILERLEQEGYRLWYDEGIDPGSEWPETIATHLDKAAACVGLISANYLASDNCRREMNFALKKQIPYLSILLEEVQMSVGVEMQLSVNQAIFKYMLPSDDFFYQKVNSTSILQSSRELPAPEPPAPAEPVIAQAPAAASEPVGLPAPTAPQAQRQKVQQPVVRKRGSKKGLVIGGIALAVVIAAVVIAIIIFGKAPDTDGSGSGTSAAAGNDSSSSGPVLSDTPLSKQGLLVDSPYAGRVLWGKKTSTDYARASDFVKKTEFMDVSLEDGLTNISVLPYSIEVRGYEKPEVIRLYYYDKVGTEHIVQAKYSIRDGILTLSPCGKVFDDASPLSEELTYDISLYYDALKLTSTTYSRSVDYTSDNTTLSGSADAAAFNDISGFEIRDFSEGSSCILLYTDGGKALDAKISMFYQNIGSLNIKWTQEQRMYNGSEAVFDEGGSCSFYYLNTYPYGFLLMDDDDVYFYQQPLTTEAE